MITGTIVGTLLLEIAQPTLAWIFLLLPMEDHTKRSLCSLLLFTSGFKSITRQSYSPALTKSRLGLSIPPLKAAQDWSSNYHDGQGANCLSNEIRKENSNYVILFWVRVVGVFNVSFFLRWRPQCSRSSRRSSPCSSPSASPSTSSSPPPRYLYLYL